MENKRDYGPLANARMEALLDQQQMADIIGCTKPSIVRIERNPGKITLERLAAYYRSVPAAGKAMIEQLVDDVVFCG